MSTPAAFQVPFSPGSVNSTRRKPSLQTRPSSTAGQFAPSVRLRCKRRGHLPFRRQERQPTRPLRGECSPPKNSPRWKTDFYRFAAKGTSSANQKPHYTVASSRQGYFAPASRDAILLDGSLMATGTTTRTSGSEESSGFFGSFFYDGCVFQKMRKSRGVIWHKLGDSRRFLTYSRTFGTWTS